MGSVLGNKRSQILLKIQGCSQYHTDAPVSFTLNLFLAPIDKSSGAPWCTWCNLVHILAV